MFPFFDLSPSRAEDRFAGFSFSFFLSFGFAAIVKLLSFGHRQFAFCYAVAKVNLRRHHGHTLLLSLNQKPLNLAPLDQQLSFSKRVVIAKTSGPDLPKVDSFPAKPRRREFPRRRPAMFLCPRAMFLLRFQQAPAPLPSYRADDSCRTRPDSAQQS